MSTSSSMKSGDCDFFAWADDMLNDAYELERKLNMINELVDVKIREMEIKVSKMKVKMNSLEEKFKEMVEKMDKRTCAFDNGFCMYFRMVVLFMMTLFWVVFSIQLKQQHHVMSQEVVGGLLPLSPM
ncbi:hypothetical protein QJS10_CPA05g01942 [Acorus calamus]|uniref:Uncharacterized protein n=1 Tax=Acorus calamus TaxID=4465 RepID=A0AAV9EQB1_ACOCL|nr:hypothetical protein QJS10_CPA05g01942 [Acorus calamus]